MIYLIGRPPRAGKSTLAKMIATEKASPYISADDLGSVIAPYIPEEELPSKLPLRTIPRETGFSNDTVFH